MDPLLIGGALAGGAASYLGGRKADQAYSRHMDTAMRWYRQLLSEQGIAGQQALGARQAALGSINKGYRSALSETQRFSDSATQGVLDREQQGIGADVQDAISMGKYNPQFMQFARRGRSYDTTLALTDIAGRAAGARAQLQSQRGLAQAGQYGDIANQIMANFMGRSGLQQNRANIVLGQESGVTDYSAAIGGLFGAFAPLPQAKDELDAGVSYRAGGGRVA